MKSDPRLLVRDALSELFVRSSEGDSTSERQLQALVAWARERTVTPDLLSVQAEDGSSLFRADGDLDARFASLESYVRDRAGRYEAARNWIRAERAEGDPLERARAAWDAGLFFEVHEVLEPTWLRERGPERPALQGLILAAAALHHLSEGNLAGAIGLCRRAPSRLDSAPDTFPVDVAALSQALETLAGRLDRQEVRGPADLHEVPPFRMRSDGAVSPARA
jgi:hypothetical protein